MRVQAVIEGVVQGVGFRPFVFRLAKERRLTGLAANEDRGVRLEVQGPVDEVERFFGELIPRKPPLAHIVNLTRTELPERPGENDFVILSSAHQLAPTGMTPPDTAVCDDCLYELFDPNDRRYLYPFINCTNCGPRYTIIKGLPYDRPLTTMAEFTMCPACRSEYDNPADRRFHAQPNACPVCGPRLWLTDAQGAVLPGRPVDQAAARLAEGNIVAVKGLGGFHLAVNATDEAAVRRLRERKNREEKPLAVMVADVETAEKLIELTEVGRGVLTSPVRPILLGRARRDHGLAPAVAPGLDRLGVMLAYAPLHYLLLAKSPPMLVMTSANQADEPIVVDNREAIDRLGEIADYFLMHDRDIHTRADDSVIAAMGGQPRVIRRARGYTIRPIRLKPDGPTVLALGPEQKNTVCLARGEDAFMSAHVGDLVDGRTLSYYEQTIAKLTGLLEVEPEALAVDCHPDYLSTLQAENYPDLPVLEVQHHAAHILSATAGLGLEPPLLGLALDGTGHGLDGSVWGGELLLVRVDGFRRLGRLKPLLLPGGDKAARQPWRAACGALHLAYGDDWTGRLPQGLAEYLAKSTDGPGMIDLLKQVLSRRINAPAASSTGRLFDAAAALVGLRYSGSTEGLAAVELEAAADHHETGAYDFQVSEQADLIEIDPGPMIRAMVEDITRRTTPGAISARFHRGLCRALATAVDLGAKKTGINQVALSGGCFMNRWLLTDLSHRLGRIGLTVHTQRDVPVNDGGVSLGQALAARLALAKGDPTIWSRES